MHAGYAMEGLVQGLLQSVFVLLSPALELIDCPGKKGQLGVIFEAAALPTFVTPVHVPGANGRAHHPQRLVDSPLPKIGQYLASAK